MAGPYLMEDEEKKQEKLTTSSFGSFSRFMCRSEIELVRITVIYLAKVWSMDGLYLQVVNQKLAAKKLTLTCRNISRKKTNF